MPKSGPEHHQPVEIREDLFYAYGTYIADEEGARLLRDDDPSLQNSSSVVLLSAPTWEETLKELSGRQFGRATVLTPELITIAGTVTESDVQAALQQAAEASRLQSEVTFIIGTPYFEDSTEKPFNAAVVLRNGLLLGVAKKRLVNPAEGAVFRSVPETTPFGMGGDTVLVCRDLIGAQTERLPGEDRTFQYVQRMMGDTTLAHRYDHAVFVAPGSQRLLVAARWGIGLQSEYASAGQAVIDRAYVGSLRGTCQSLLRFDASLQQIIVCDWSPGASRSEPTSSSPMSAVFTRG